MALSDDDAIIRCVSNYVEGWYEADSGRMDLALSKYLAKRRVVSADEIWDVSKDWMIAATGQGRGRIDEPGNGVKRIAILDRTATMASVRLESNDFIDYLHLANYGGAWRIVNALWDFRDGAEGR